MTVEQEVRIWLLNEIMVAHSGLLQGLPLNGAYLTGWAPVNWKRGG